MSHELISPGTRRQFREWLVNWVLRDIEDLFDDEGLLRASVPNEVLPQGARRSLVVQYYASVDWADPISVRRILNAYEHILRSISDDVSAKEQLVQCLQRDGYSVLQNRIRSRGIHEDLESMIRTTTIVNLEHLNVYVERIRASVDEDPELAIGSTKELVEATLKTVLSHFQTDYDSADEIPSLMKRVQGVLDLDPGDVDGNKKGASSIRRVLGATANVVVGIAELRNAYGSGHGRARRTALQPRHARLCVGSGTTLCRFLLETLVARSHEVA